MTETELTSAQRRHLQELVNVANGQGRGEAYWTPRGSGEFRCADVLSRRGLIQRAGFHPTQYALTQAGRLALHSQASDEGKA